MSFESQFEDVVLETIRIRHPGFGWRVCLFDHGRKIGVMCLPYWWQDKPFKGEQMSGPRDDYLEIADALAEQLEEFEMTADEIAEFFPIPERSRKRLELRNTTV